MKTMSIPFLTVALLAAIPATSLLALEKTASSKDIQNVANGFDARLNAASSILQTTINQILTCNNKKKIFASDTSVPNRDANGCVSSDVDMADYQIVEEVVSIPLGSCPLNTTKSCERTWDLSDAVKKAGSGKPMTIKYELVSNNGATPNSTAFTIPNNSTDEPNAEWGHAVYAYYAKGKWKHYYSLFYDGSKKLLESKLMACDGGGCSARVGLEKVSVEFPVMKLERLQ